MSVPYQIGRERLVNLLFAQGIDTSQINKGFTSPTYVLPSRQWFFGPFAEYFFRWRQKCAPDGYQPGKWVCHRYAQACALVAGICHAETVGALAMELCIGEFWFARDEGGEHAICFAYVHDETRPGEDPQLVFMEPQTSGESILSAAEKRSCEFVRV